MKKLSSGDSGSFCYDMPFDQYRKLAGINASSIAHGRKSMLHMYHAMTQPSKSTPAMEFGTLAHYAILEGGEGLLAYNGRRGSKEHSAAIEVAGDERLVCKADDYDQVCAMRDIVYSNSDACHLLENSEKEVSCIWSANYGKAKMRVDGMSETTITRPFIYDYKTTGNIEPSAFFRTAENLGYHIKMGWYVEGFDRIFGIVPDVFVIVQEKDLPHDCFVCQIPQVIIDQGREESIEIATLYHCCEVSNSFPGVVESGLIDYERPVWALGGDEIDVTNGTMEGSEL